MAEAFFIPPAEPDTHQLVIVIYNVSATEAEKVLATRRGQNPVREAAKLVLDRRWSISLVDDSGQHADWEPDSA